ncbi:hypothetical protein E2562_036336 [Oryza meyeriana var. granulata]|uniref:DUF834 domain-containing protein n=1 Tax=Oryza meyeriana var. granulata TaxID=110450 RepID=A0A6G1CB22_9ORYZ|nr:hypothetical protein E2562_036336 [Oryza meyeriana var. granulata]
MLTRGEKREKRWGRDGYDIVSRTVARWLGSAAVGNGVQRQRPEKSSRGGEARRCMVVAGGLAAVAGRGLGAVRCGVTRGRAGEKESGSDVRGMARQKERRRRREGSVTAALALGRLELLLGLEDGERGPGKAWRERGFWGSIYRRRAAKWDKEEAVRQWPRRALWLASLTGHAVARKEIRKQRGWRPCRPEEG